MTFPLDPVREILGAHLAFMPAAAPDWRQLRIGTLPDAGGYTVRQVYLDGDETIVSPFESECGRALVCPTEHYGIPLNQAIFMALYNETFLPTAANGTYEHEPVFVVTWRGDWTDADGASIDGHSEVRPLAWFSDDNGFDPVDRFRLNRLDVCGVTEFDGGPFSYIEIERLV